MMLAALLAMVLVAAAPALAQQGDDATNQSTSSLQACLTAFGDQNANVQQNVPGDENETGAAIGQDQAQYCEQAIQNALAATRASPPTPTLEVNGVDDDGDGAVDEGDGAGAAASAAAGTAAGGSGAPPARRSRRPVALAPWRLALEPSWSVTASSPAAWLDNST